MNAIDSLYARLCRLLYIFLTIFLSPSPAMIRQRAPVSRNFIQEEGSIP